LNPFLCATERKSPHIAVLRVLEEGMRAVEEDTPLGLTTPELEMPPKRFAKQGTATNGV
jgi:hypothetical protein